MKSHEPSLEEQFITLPSGEYQRLIFHNQELREKEETHLEQFKDYCEENNIVIPEGYDDQNKYMLRILWKKNWKYDVAAKEILEHHEWKQATYPI